MYVLRFEGHGLMWHAQKWLLNICHLHTQRTAVSLFASL